MKEENVLRFHAELAVAGPLLLPLRLEVTIREAER